MDSLNAILREMTRDTRVATYLTSSQNSESSYTCPLCKDREFTIEVDEQGYEYAKICVCRERRNAERRLHFAELPDAYKLKRITHLTFSVFTQDVSRQMYQTCLKIAETYIEKFDDSNGKGLYFYSRAKGSGKTAMITAIGAELLAKGHGVKFATSSKILNEIKGTWSGEGESKLLHDLVEIPVLIIDDFGAEKTKGWINEKFFYIINERYLQKRTTMFTSNYSLSELDFDSRIVDRVREMTYEVPFPEEGLRDGIAKEDKKQFYSEVAKNEKS